MKFEMKNWISISTRELELPKEKTKIRGVELQLAVSPYDIPTAVRGHHDEKLKKFVIEFQYVDEGEDTQTNRLDDLLSVEQGKYSGRIYKMIVNSRVANARAVSLQLGCLVSERLTKVTPVQKVSRLNYDLVKQVIASRQNQIFSDSDCTLDPN